MKKGDIQIDYILAAGIFILMFVIIIQFTTSYFSNIKQDSDIYTLRNRAFSLLASKDFYPQNWTDENIQRVGFYTDAYRFYILVNNTGTSLSDEIIRFNYTDISADENSTVIYDEDIDIVPYQYDSGIFSFTSNFSAGESKFFTVYFDDDSNFISASSSISGTDSIGETIYPIEKISIMQYKKLSEFSLSNYTKIKERVGFDFSIEIYDTDKNSTFFIYGDPIEEGNVVALSDYVLYQNSTAGIGQGRFIVSVW